MNRSYHATQIALSLALVVACTLAILALSSCGGSAGAAGGSTQNGAATGAAFNPPASLSLPQVDPAAGPIDTRHAAEGYVVANTSSASKLKFQVSKDDMVYNYDLPNDNTPTVFPINMGDGTYLFRIMQNTDANNYVEINRLEENVTLNSEFAPFLIPNMFCNYNDQSACVAKASELTASSQNVAEAVEAICTYVIDNVDYDTAKAKTLTTITGYVPNPDSTLESGMGVCFDYASLGAAMLRSLGIPTKVITGYVSPGDLYHAWIMVYVDGSWHTGEFSVNPDTWSRVDLTFAASGSTEYTGDGANYTERYVY